MTNSTLLEIIMALNAQERQEMAHFLASPLYNRGRNAQELSKLFQEIIQTAPDFSSELLKKERIYFLVFDDKQQIKGKLDKLMTELNQQLRLFAVTKRFLAEENEIQRQLEWAAWLRERNLRDRSMKVLEKLKDQEAEHRKESIDQLRFDLRISEENHIWESTYNQARGDLDIAQVIYQLDLYYQNYRLELQNRFLLQKKVAVLPELDDYLSNIHSNNTDSILLQVSERIFQMLKKDLPSIEEARHLMNLLNEHENAIAYGTLDNLYAYLRNFYTLLINAGHVAFLPILHQLNKDNLDRGFFSINGKISSNAYLNISIVAIKMKAFDWAKQFTESYKDLILNGDEDRFFYKLNMVYCLFAERNFEAALDNLPDPPPHSIYHQKIRRLELQLYFELRSELLEYKIDAFRKYNERTASKSIAANVREMNANFLNLLLQITQSPLKNKARSAQLIQRIQSKKLVAERAWLIEKAQELS